MKKINLLLILILSNFGMFSQIDKVQQKLVEKELFIKKISDSLNSITNTDINLAKIPVFSNVNYDLKIGSKFRVTMHSSESLRKLIIDKIINIKLLKIISNSNLEQLNYKKLVKSKSMFDYPIPFENYSIIDLVNFRLEELKNEKYCKQK